MPQTLEEGVVVGHAAILHGSRIGKDTLIGMGARLLSGCEIGAECLVAAGYAGSRRPQDSAARGRYGDAGQGGANVTEEEIVRDA